MINEILAVLALIAIASGLVAWYSLRKEIRNSDFSHGRTR